MTNKLSPSDYRLLGMVDESTQWLGDERPGTVLVGCYVPSFIAGGKDRGHLTTFKSLERKGLIKGLIEPEARAPYGYSITEDGLATLAQYVCEHGFSFHSSCQSCQREIVGA